MATIEDSIIHSIKKNGYPEKKVSLPFQSIFKACKNADKTLSDVLKSLEAQDIKSKIDGDKIIFSSTEFSEAKDSPQSPEGLDFSNEMVRDAMKKIQEMDPKELEKLKQQVESLSEDEKGDLMKRAQELFSKSSS